MQATLTENGDFTGNLYGRQGGQRNYQCSNNSIFFEMKTATVIKVVIKKGAERCPLYIGHAWNKNSLTPVTSAVHYRSTSAHDWFSFAFIWVLTGSLIG